MPNKNNKPKYGQRKRRNRARKAASRGANKPSTLVLRTRVMLQASVNTATSFVKQINITPYLGLFPVAVQQSKFYQQYRMSRVRYVVMPTSCTNTQTTTGNLATQLMYSVPLYNSSIPGANESAYLAYKNARVSTLRGMVSGSFVPYVPTSQQTTNAEVMVKSPIISTKETNPLHFGHSLLFVQQAFNAFAYIRVMVQATFEFYHFDGEKASVTETYEDLRSMMSRQLAPDLQTTLRRLQKELMAECESDEDEHYELISNTQSKNQAFSRKAPPDQIQQLQERLRKLLKQ